MGFCYEMRQPSLAHEGRLSRVTIETQLGADSMRVYATR